MSNSTDLTIFRNDIKPKISLKCYLERFLTYGDFSYHHLLAGLVIAKRFYENVGEKKGELCSFKIYGASLFLVHKFLDEDEHWSIEDYGTISGYRASTLLALEDLLCEILDYQIFVSRKDLEEITEQFGCVE